MIFSKFSKKFLPVLTSVILVVTLIFSCLITERIYGAEYQAMVTDDGVRVRTGPGTSYSIITSLNTGTYITWTGEEEYGDGLNWYRITSSYFSGYGYICSDYVSVIDDINYDEDFEKAIEIFPESYKPYLRIVHQAYPNYVFSADYVGVDFSDTVTHMCGESGSYGKKVYYSDSDSYKGMFSNNYNWNTMSWYYTEGGWTYASREVVAYYLDPRNFINTSQIYTFMQQSFNDAVTIDDVRDVIGSSFLSYGYTTDENDPYNGDYAELIYNAGLLNGVNPCILASTILQEQGYWGNTYLVSGDYPGYEGYYNFFNYGATGSTTTDVIINGLTYAKNQGWNSVYACILGSAGRYASGYINQGQDTYYYKDFNVVNDVSDYWHQYATAVYDASSSGGILRSAFSSDKYLTLSFRIPVYENMPENACPIHAANSSLNNYYFDYIIGDLDQTYSRYKRNYAFNSTMSEDTYITVGIPSGATYTGKDQYNLVKGSNTVSLTIKSQTGYTRTYRISIEAENNCTLYVKVNIPFILSDYNLNLNTETQYQIDSTTSGLNWSSSNPNIVSVDSNGLVTANRYGTATISISGDSGYSDTVTVQTRYYDVADSSKSYYKYVYWAADNNITKGYDNVYFAPDQECSRLNFVIFLWRIFGNPEATAATSFSDIAEGDTGYSAIQWAVENGIIKGFSDGTFKPEESVTRRQVVIMLRRAAGNPVIDESEFVFSDVQNGMTGHTAISWASEIGLAKGFSDGTFRPDDSCTRAQTVIFLYRFYNAFIK